MSENILINLSIHLSLYLLLRLIALAQQSHFASVSPVLATAFDWLTWRQIPDDPEEF